MLPSSEPTPEPTLQPASQPLERINYVQYNGNYYSTLADVAVDSSQLLCQTDYITLPDNWVIAPDNADSIAVIAAHYWSTHCVVVVSGTSYCGLQYGSGSGGSCGSGLLLSQGGAQYAVSSCTRQILIMCKLFI